MYMRSYTFRRCIVYLCCSILRDADATENRTVRRTTTSTTALSANRTNFPARTPSVYRGAGCAITRTIAATNRMRKIATLRVSAISRQSTNQQTASNSDARSARVCRTKKFATAREIASTALMRTENAVRATIFLFIYSYLLIFFKRRCINVFEFSIFSDFMRHCQSLPANLPEKSNGTVVPMSGGLQPGQRWQVVHRCQRVQTRNLPANLPQRTWNLLLLVLRRFRFAKQQDIMQSFRYENPRVLDIMCKYCERQ